jgi:hypothetical protein
MTVIRLFREQGLYENSPLINIIHGKRLLVDLVPSPWSLLLRPARMTVGNGATITTTVSGSLHLWNTTLENVLARYCTRPQRPQHVARATSITHSPALNLVTTALKG